MIQSILSFLNEFEKCVVNKDYSAAKNLYSKSAKNFGTRVDFSSSIDDYVERQWNAVWEISRNFRFNDLLFCDESLNYCLVTWQNETLIDSLFTLRQGRATFIFDKSQRELLCVHSHFSNI
jgi:ketosteroid isomerase-like protein